MGHIGTSGKRNIRLWALYTSINVQVSKLPLENRYIWRIASALKWAFCDFDSISVEADRATLVEADLKKLLELLQLRPAQFCLFLKALIGEQEMERVMLEALAMAKGD